MLCSTPDSLIESGSDSASFIGSSKKDHPRAQLNASGSEFGSLTSIQITQDDDLDSGVGGGAAGGRQHPPPVVINDSEISLNDSSNFEIRRLPARSTKDLTLEGCEEASPNMLSTHPLPPASYASSRSMSNLHRSNASPQRTRRKWDAPEYNNASSSPNNGHVYQQPIQNPQVNMITSHNNNNANSGLSTSISLQGLRSHANYDSPLSGPKNSFAPVPQRIVPGTFTNSPTSKPHYPGQNTSSSSAAMGYYEDNFDRANASRNSLTKKFMNLSSGPSSLATTPNNEPPKTVWTPQKYENNRRPSNLFNNFSSAPSQGIHRR
uniref:Uncharacterized protein n=1 Tax=Panagrolaimus sp. ES5 TaxID=591445 RepID=A0AC34FPU3_9BILA